MVAILLIRVGQHPAHVIPTNIASLALAGGGAAEIETVRLLQKKLSDAYTVFHGVHWTRAYASGTQFGEIDIVVTNRDGRAIVIEQKSGALEETDDGLVKHYNGKAKSVRQQVHRTIDAIRDKFRGANPGHGAIDLDYLVYCPDHRLLRLNAAGLDADRIVDARQAAWLPEKIETLLGLGGGTDLSRGRPVDEFFRQHFEVVPDIHAHVDAQSRAYTRFTGGLADLLAGLEMEPFRLRILGTAGCGKTLLATRLFDRFAAAGQRPLLVCFNRPLAERLRSVIREGGLVRTWFGLVDECLKDQGRPLDFGSSKTDKAFWDRAAESVLDIPLPERWKFDALIVDEAQDLNDVWHQTLRLFLRDGAHEIYLEDADQNVHGQVPLALAGFTRYRCRRNFRSPISIATFIRGILPFKFETGNELPGLGVGITAYTNTRSQQRALAKVLSDLIGAGFEHGDIVVLTARHLHSGLGAPSAFAEISQVGKLKLRRFTGEYDLFGNQILTNGEIHLDSLYRFKGQQSPAVVVTDLDDEFAASPDWQCALFTALTRATVRLEILVDERSRLRDLLSTDQP